MAGRIKEVPRSTAPDASRSSIVLDLINTLDSDLPAPFAPCFSLSPPPCLIHFLRLFIVALFLPLCSRGAPRLSKNTLAAAATCLTRFGRSIKQSLQGALQSSRPNHLSSPPLQMAYQLLSRRPRNPKGAERCAYISLNRRCVSRELKAF